MSGQPPGEQSILLVEDQRKTREEIRTFFERQGYHVLEAADGIEAIKLYRANRPRVILIDAMLPKLHGFQVCKSIKDAAGQHDVYVAVLSAVFKKERYQKEAKSRYLADNFFVKPLNMPELQRHIEDFLREYHTQTVPLDEAEQSAPSSAPEEQQSEPASPSESTSARKKRSSQEPTITIDPNEELRQLEQLARGGKDSSSKSN